jgi:hypothetical protein
MRKDQPEQSQPLTPKVHAIILSDPPSCELAGYCRGNNETYPTQNKISLYIFLCSDGLVQKPLEALQQGQGTRMQTPKCFKRRCLKGHWRFLSRQHDGIAGLLIFSSTRSSPTRHKMLKIGNSERRRINDIDVEVMAYFPLVKMEVCTTAFRARDGCRKRWFPGDSLSS